MTYGERSAAAWENNNMSAPVSHPFTWMADIGAPLASDREKNCQLHSLVPPWHTHIHTHTHRLVLCQNVISYFTPSLFCWLGLSTLARSLSFTHCRWKTCTLWRRSRRCVNSALTPRWCHLPQRTFGEQESLKTQSSCSLACHIVC